MYDVCVFNRGINGEAIVSDHACPACDDEQNNLLRHMTDVNDRLRSALKDCVIALQNIENDDGGIPHTIWSMVQEAISKAEEDLK